AQGGLEGVGQGEGELADLNVNDFHAPMLPCDENKKADTFLLKSTRWLRIKRKALSAPIALHRIL
ncbi:MAG: hypothetical protein K2F83_00835, partial [Oscillospiraceae bacterium]|nr:hypothetical protein [Oscillospiraceae bacterium]